MLRHRDSWAVEATAPSQAEWQQTLATEHQPERPATTAESIPARPEVRRIAAGVSATPTPVPSSAGLATEFERDILIVVSKMKKYIKDRSGMNCSDAVAEGLSDHVRLICDQAIRTAGADGRKTVLDRDVPKLPR